MLLARDELRSKVRYHSREPGSVTKMLADLDLPSLQERRRENRLCLLYKIDRGLVPAIDKNTYLKPIRAKRKIKAKTYENCETKNFVRKYQNLNSKCFELPHCTEHKYVNSFFPKTITEWNQLDDHIVSAPSVNIFKDRLRTQ